MNEKQPKIADWKQKKRDMAYALFKDGHISADERARITKDINYGNSG